MGKGLHHMLKLLDIGKPLSIQAHPTAEQAAKLFKAKPHIYPDGNPKPEMFLALSDTEFLAGPTSFGGVLELPPYKGLGTDLEKVFKAIAGMPDENVSALLSSLLENLRLYPAGVQAVIKSVSQSHPLDTGLVLVPLLQVHHLPAGSCFFVEPPTVHCYLSGHLAEIMAPSDNVIRLGLTAKPKDTDSADLVRLRMCKEIPSFSQGKLKLFNSPEPKLNFAVGALGPGETQEAIEDMLLIVLSGEGTVAGQPVAPGSCAWVAKGSLISGVEFVGSFERLDGE
jgi:mannose-6-phosphate isomerase